MMDPLREELCRLAAKLEPAGVRIVLGGGYGLLLKSDYLWDAGADTVAPTPFPRATEDLDVILTANVVVDPESMGAVRDALRDLGYEPLEGRKFYQWARAVELPRGVERTVKIDLLGQIPEDRSRISLKPRRMRPHHFTGLHANPLEEAALIDLRPTTVRVCDAEGGPSVDLPHPFNYLLLKLSAFDDRKEDAETDFGRHHAFDLYRIVAMLTREEWAEVVSFRDSFDGTGVVAKAMRIVEENFSGDEQRGALRLREHVQTGVVDVGKYPVEEFLLDLTELMTAR